MDRTAVLGSGGTGMAAGAIATARRRLQARRRAVVGPIAAGGTAAGGPHAADPLEAADRFPANSPWRLSDRALRAVWSADRRDAVVDLASRGQCAGCRVVAAAGAGRCGDDALRHRGNRL